MGRLRVLIVLFAIIAVMVAAGACSRHDDKPPMLGVQQPPNPQNVTVTTQDNITFDITWTINNPSLVSSYNIYTQDPFTGQATFADSTTTTAVTVSTGGFPLPGLVIGVASVTTENVESQIIFASADP